MEHKKEGAELIKKTESQAEQIKVVILYGVFICYIALLIKILILSRVSILELFNSQRIVERSVNLTPFYSIREYLFNGSAGVKEFAFGNVVGNVVLFIPMGAFLMLLKKDKRVKIHLLLIFLLSTLVESAQGLLGIGAFDIDDIILNCLGGIIGVLGYQFLWMIWREERKVQTTAVVLSLMGTPAILYLLFVMQMRF